MSDTAIKFENVSKLYRLGTVGTGTLSHDLKRWWITSIRGKDDPYLKIGETNDRSSKGTSDYVYALKDIDFEVKQGDVLGIIGKNGAGKSTLLKLLSRVTAPTSGKIYTKGRIASLLEVGTGFHPELTGRENIYMNGTILGMKKWEIDKQLDEIVDFSGCERYLDTPVKRYSSGMTVRLGFAIAAHLNPEILVVDEVLAVGDAEFQKKAIGKMKDVSSSGGRTVLFVSHNMAAVRSLCNNGIVLKNGMINFTGTSEDAIEAYMKTNLDWDENDKVSEMPRNHKCSGKIRFVDVKYLDENNQETSPRCGRYLKIRCFLNVQEPGFKDVYISASFENFFGDQLSTFPSNVTRSNFFLNPGSQYVDLIIPKLPLLEAEYKIGLWISINTDCADSLVLTKPMGVEDDLYFNTGCQYSKEKNGKIVLCDHYWEIND